MLRFDVNETIQFVLKLYTVCDQRAEHSEPYKTNADRGGLDTNCKSRQARHELNN
jgi:hypothetical protein